MRIETAVEEPDFAPRTITITLDSREDVINLSAAIDSATDLVNAYEVDFEEGVEDTKGADAARARDMLFDLFRTAYALEVEVRDE